MQSTLLNTKWEEALWIAGNGAQAKKAKKEGNPDENLGTGLPEINPLMALAQMRTAHTVGID
jgi:hypothetical protein